MLQTPPLRLRSAIFQAILELKCIDLSLLFKLKEEKCLHSGSSSHMQFECYLLSKGHIKVSQEQTSSVKKSCVHLRTNTCKFH